MDNDEATFVIAAYNFMQQENGNFVSKLFAEGNWMSSVTGQKSDRKKDRLGKRNAVAEFKADHV